MAELSRHAEEQILRIWSDEIEANAKAWALVIDGREHSRHDNRIAALDDLRRLPSAARDWRVEIVAYDAVGGIVCSQAFRREDQLGPIGTDMRLVMRRG